MIPVAGAEIIGACHFVKDWPTFHELRDLIEPMLDGGDMEHVTVFWQGHYTDMFVDEVGHRKGLDRNERATDIYRANVLTHERHPPQPEDMPWIAGPAVLFDKRVWR